MRGKRVLAFLLAGVMVLSESSFSSLASGMEPKITEEVELENDNENLEETSLNEVTLDNEEVASENETINESQDPIASSKYLCTINFPSNGQKYWVIFREGTRNHRIEMSTCNILGNDGNARIEWNNGLSLKGATAENVYNQYYLNGNQWEQIGTYNRFSDFASSVIASNLDIYKSTGELVIEKTDYDGGSQYEIEQSDTNIKGNCGQNLTWILDKATGLLTINGIGDMSDFSKEIPPWYAYKDSILKVTVNNGVSSIGNYAFYECSALTGISIQESVTKIGDYAFYNCKSMQGALELPEGLTVLGKFAFYGCGALSGGLKIPEGISEIKDYTFYNCKGFDGGLTLPESMAKIESYAFYGCSGLTGTLHLPEGLEDVKEYTFYGCKGFTGELRVPDSVKKIERSAFDGCAGLEGVVVGNGVTNMYKSVFYGCTGVERMKFLGEKVPVINSNLSASSSNTNDINYFFGSGSLKNLKTIYTFSEYLEAYKSAWSSYVPRTVTFSADTLSLPISNLTAYYVNSHSAGLRWNASVNKDIIGYHVYRDGTKVSDTAELIYEDTNLKADTTYEYSVAGYTGDGAESREASLTVVTKLPEVKKIYTDNSLNKVCLTNGNLYALVSNTGNLENASGRFYYLNEGNEQIPIGDRVNHYSQDSKGAVYKRKWKINDITPGDYTVYFELTDADGESDALSQTIIVDDSRPEALTNVIAVGNTNQIVLSWTIAHEIDTVRYHIYRRTEDEDEFTLIKKINDRNILSYTDTNVNQNKKYYYYVVGVNTFGQEGEPSNTAVAIPLADTEPPRVVRITPVNNSIIGSHAEFYVNAEDNVAVTKTELYLSTDSGDSWKLLKAVNGNYCNYTLATAQYEDGVIQIKGLAYDAAGNVSNPLIYSYKIDNTGPEKVTGLTFESTATTITLRWKDVADNDFSFFRVERKQDDGKFTVVQDVYSTLGANIYNLESDKEYTFRVVAYDQLGNRGEASDEIVVRTEKDTIAPVITAIRPSADYYNKEIALKITATDNAGIASVLIQTSTNAIIWDDYKTVTFSGKNKTEVVSETLLLDELPEGNLYVRGVATDISENVGDSTNDAPYVQYIVDRTAPAAPQNFKANAITGAIELSWDMGIEEDLDSYTVYRSADAENYTVLAKGLYSLNYWDRTAVKGTTYWYKATVCDKAGNISDKTDAVEIILPDDTEPPVIESFAPVSGSIIGPSNSVFQVMVSDNWKVDKAIVSYTVNDDKEPKVLISQSDINNYYKLLSKDIPIADFSDKDVLHFSISVEDVQGINVSKSDITYTVDKTAPKVNAVSPKADLEKIVVSWEGNAEEDLAGYRIYRKSASGKYELIGQRAASAGTKYEYVDENALAKETYYYKVEAVDRYGNTHAKESEAVWLEVESAVSAQISCDKVMEVNVEYYFDATASFADMGIKSYKFDFGDGTITEGTDAKVIHRYQSTGEYTVSLMVTDNEDQKAYATCSVKVEEPKLLGAVKIKAVDVSENKIVGMPVYFDLDHTSDNVKYTDANGYAQFTERAGLYAVGAYADGYLPVKKSIVVRAGEETELSITLIQEPIVTGEFEVSRMTLDEIKAAGIDVSDPANQQVVKVTIHLVYGSTPVTMNVVTNGSKIYSGETTIVDTNEGKRKLTASVVDSGEKGSQSSAGGMSGDNVIIAIMDVPVEASFLKEFFDVKLHIVNHADTGFELTNNVVKLNVPHGLTLVDSYFTDANDTVTFESLKGQQKKTINWILRGDNAGEYDLEADYSAVLNQFNRVVTAKFKTETPITVYGLGAIKLIADINSSLAYGGMYFNLSLQNIGEADIYLPSIDVDGQIISCYEEAKNDEQPAGGGIGGGGGALSGIEARLQLLDVLLKNAQGYSLSLGKDAVIDKLSPGEIYTKEYAYYNAVTETDMAYLQEAVAKTAEDIGIAVEVNMVDMDLYSIDDADEKVQSFLKDNNKLNIYWYFVHNDNFHYYIDAEKDDNDFMKKLGEAFKRSADAVLKLDMDLFTSENMRNVTRQYIYEMLMDETFQTAVCRKADDTYLKVTKNTLSLITGALADNEEDVIYEDATITQKAVQDITGILGRADTIRSLAGTLKIGGEDGFWSRLLTVIGAEGGSVALEVLKLNMEKNKVANWIGLSMKQELKSITPILNVLSNISLAWNKSVELTNQMVVINAAQAEALTLLDFILKHDEINNAVYEEVKSIRNNLVFGINVQGKKFGEEITKLAITDIVDKGASLILKKLNSIYYPNTTFGVTAVVSALKIAYGTLDYVFGWEDKVNSLQSLRVAASLTYALRAETVHYTLSGDNETFLMALKYLIKMRLVGERAWINIYRDNNVDTIESEFAGGEKQDIDEYYQIFKETVLSYRDILFGSVAESLNAPKAPEVSIDYEKETTVLTYDSSYEYSFDGTTWLSCDGSAIPLNPGTVGRHLWIRVKETEKNRSGNIRKMYVPARNLISDTITAKYKEGKYYISGLPAAAYYQLTDERIENMGTSLTIEPEGSVTTLSGDYHKYIAIALKATDSSFRSAVINLEVEKDKTVTVTFTGWRDAVLSSQQYEADLSDVKKIQVPVVPIIDGYEFKGWQLNGSTYSADEICEAIRIRLSALQAVNVQAKYEQKEEIYKLTVKNGTLEDGNREGNYRPSTILKVTADETESGKKFVYWKKDEVIVSYTKSYKFYMPGADTVMEAVYEDEETEVEAVGASYIEKVTKDTAAGNLVFVSVGTVPEGCSIVLSGIVATSAAGRATNGVELNSKNADYVRGGGAGCKAYKYTWTKTKVTAEQTWYVRSYLKYKDKTGAEHEIYGEMIKASTGL